MATTTVTELVSAAMRKLGVLASGRNPTSQEILDGRKDFDALIEDWRFDDLMVVANTIATFTLTNKSSYSIYASGAADFNTERPINVHGATIIGATGVRTPLVEMTAQEYAAEQSRAITATPSRFVYLPTYPQGTVAFDRIPLETTVELLLEQPLLSAPATNDAAIDLAPGFYDAILYNLAMRLAPEHDIDPSRMLIAMAGQTRKMIVNRNFSVPRISPRGPGTVSKSYDINAGP